MLWHRMDESYPLEYFSSILYWMKRACIRITIFLFFVFDECSNQPIVGIETTEMNDMEIIAVNFMINFHLIPSIHWFGKFSVCNLLLLLTLLLLAFYLLHYYQHLLTSISTIYIRSYDLSFNTTVILTHYIKILTKMYFVCNEPMKWHFISLDPFCQLFFA